MSERVEGGKDYFLSQLSSLNVATADDGVCCQRSLTHALHGLGRLLKETQAEYAVGETWN